MPKTRDLFDDTSMTFGEHLEVLRIHVFRALIGVVIAVAITLFFGDRLFYWLRSPIETALKNRGVAEEDIKFDAPKQSLYEYLTGMFSSAPEKVEEPVVDELKSNQLRVSIAKSELQKALGQPVDEIDVPQESVEPAANAAQSSETVPKPESKEAESKTESGPEPEMVTVILTAPEFAQLQRVIEDTSRITTLKVEEGFMAYMKVCFLAGLLLASPWVFYQLWLFVAAGLYPHERKYVHIYLPMSVVLFLAGAMAGYFYAFPLMLDFLIGFNAWLGIGLEPRLSEYVSLAMLMPLMFGVSFQLPLVMVFLERLGICTVQTYKDNWRVAVLVISIASMVLTTSPDPWSMLLMMFPLLLLYVLGIFMCGFKVQSPASPIR